MNLSRPAALLVIALSVGCELFAQQLLKVDLAHPGATIQPTMWGVFFEDINMGADGGLYAELVKNRSFEFTRPMMGWTVLGKPETEGDFTVLNRANINPNNPRFLRVQLHHNTFGSAGLANEGFRGMGIRAGTDYNFSMMYRCWGKPVKLGVELINETAEVIAHHEFSLGFTGADWQRTAVHFAAAKTAMKASMRIWFEGDGPLDMDMVSLFPADTWKQRPGGLRADMVQRLADLKPGFIRFPGGCIVEGFDLSQRYQWKKTLGPVADREVIMNRWNNEFAHRPTPDYFQSFGLGFFEYFQLAEDIGAAPLPILNCGMACQFNSAELVATEDLLPYVQDALDLVEFANGDTTTKWGKVRQQLGHSAPFHLTMMGVGNENWGPQYLERLAIFSKALHNKYPDIKLVSSSGTDPAGERFTYLDSALRNMHADIIDEHYYRKPEWFFANAARYDHYSRTGAKIFGGEYAAQSDKTVSVDNKNCWLTALAEAAFMTGLERNAEVVNMASYAPLFAHVDGWQWTPDLIWVNNLQSYGTPDYYVQQLFSTNRGTNVIPVTSNGSSLSGQDSLFATACLDKPASTLIVKLVNANGNERKTSIRLDGAVAAETIASVITLSSTDLAAVNSFESPTRVSPQQSTLRFSGKLLNLTLSPYSVNVLRLKIRD